MKRALRRPDAQESSSPPLLDAERGRVLIEEIPEIVLVADEDDRIVAASRRARDELEGLRLGGRADDVLGAENAVRVPFEVDGRRETLLYVPGAGGPAYDELRAAFTAAVSHELRTPLARLLALLESALLPNAEVASLVEQARGEVEQIAELVDDVLFLSELETRREVVVLGVTPARPILVDVVERLAERALRADVQLRVEADDELALPLRPRMLRVVAENLAVNAIRYAGLGATCTLAVERRNGELVLRATDDGAGVAEADLPRLFERFFRGDRVRASRGTGLGLAIVKHIVNAAGGAVEATGAPGRGLEVRCVFRAQR